MTRRTRDGRFLVVVVVVLICVLFTIASCEGGNITIEMGGNAVFTCVVQFNETTTPVEGQIKWKWKPETENKYRLFQGMSFINIFNIVGSSVARNRRWKRFCSNYKLDRVHEFTTNYTQYPPDTPREIHCETNGMLSIMTCCWDIGRETYLNATYTVTYTIHSYEEGIENVSSMSNCIGLDVTSYYNREYAMNVTAANDLGESVSDLVTYTPCKAVKTGPPSNVTVIYCEGSGTQSSSLLVKWAKPTDTRGYLNLEYKTRHRIANSDDIWHNDERIPDLTTRIINLHPNTQYEVQVAAKPADSWYGGFWSDWSEEVLQTTANTGLNFPSHTTHYTYELTNPGYNFFVSGTYCNSIGCSGTVTETVNLSAGRSTDGESNFFETAIQEQVQVQCSTETVTFNFSNPSPCYGYFGFVSRNMVDGIQEIITMSLSSKATLCKCYVYWIVDTLCSILCKKYKYYTKICSITLYMSYNTFSSSYFLRIYFSLFNSAYLHKPERFQWVNPLTLTWSQPRHKNGNIGGYFVQYGIKNEDTTKTPPQVQTTKTSIDTDITCSDSNNQSIYWAEVSAYNINDDQTKLYGNSSYIEGMPCAMYVAVYWLYNLTLYVILVQGPITPIDVGLMIGLAFGIAALVATFALAHYHRKKIKKALREKIWPPVPEPNIYIGFTTDVASIDCVNPAISNLSLQSFSSRDNDLVDEVAADIRDITYVNPCPENKANSTNANNRTSVTSDHNHNNNNNSSITSDTNQDPIEDLGLQSNDSESGGTNVDSTYTYSTFMAYSVVSPLLTDSRDVSGQISSGTSSWRSLLYPRATAQLNLGGLERPTRRRASSYCESVTSRSTGLESYVRYCRQPNRVQNSDHHTNTSARDSDSSPMITYTRIAVGMDGSPTFVPEANSDDATANIFVFPDSNTSQCRFTHHRLRGESWYGKYSTEGDSLFQSSDLNYKGSLASYVAEVDQPNHPADSGPDCNEHARDNGENLEPILEFGSMDSVDQLYPGRARENNINRSSDDNEEQSKSTFSYDSEMPQTDYVTVGEAMSLGANGSELATTLSTSDYSFHRDMLISQSSSMKDDHNDSHDTTDDFLHQDNDMNQDEENGVWTLTSQQNAVENDYITAVSPNGDLN
uniref:Class I cytokine receptor glycoprotein 130-like n=1 Tax=Ciona intestinalis TaxID=7719 RepID=A8WHA6_CIOIN|nr:class I cytokine receptor glycoprotein 130-like precursor [Ciona intestinalis]CAL08001.1 TPA: class I cytokine receptor glycoprotein 130-like [Ciona intestinalis]|eukprot:NP_001107599.1 class I cytokine receptor glycoprotein 130-like precursor [Ciona intestinalis]